MIFLKRILAWPIRWYQKEISPGLPRRCRYSPTCSQYALQALEVHGALKGTLLSAWRLVRCNPWSKGGVDRVPARGAWPSRPLDYDDLMALYQDEDRVPNT
ncbi:MAG: membrane protein insertion efficiency factor YidD [Ancrocorticia sp.]|nr:membrane protein insertion efficiency factor YidD [Ancrocorticia sp.]